ncbi:hemerythrin domain-containing protein [uncultured Ramlibacter sp.]|uniref:hemerythrin domain-containing protein n=1 Tax=uncultured Ramlibacter sp. TaxID=260755 RepID=UPI002616542F|nr:hemerythrin domain-containing protein [uncultured Ramlibacter sp.]
MRRFAIQAICEEHSAVAAVLRSLLLMIERGPDHAPERFFDVLRAMLFYIDEFPEKLHHPKESDLLFPKLARADAGLMPVIRRLESDHMQGEGKVRELQHMLLAWELLGEPRRAAFCEAAQAYVGFYLEHMRLEETQILPAAQRVLSERDWEELDAAFRRDRDPLASGERPAGYDRLFTRIVMAAPAPIGLGEPLAATA